jgi:endonuclease-3
VGSRPREILNTLLKTYSIQDRFASSRDPFKTLIATIISQNTTNRNSTRAFENLSKNLRITPETLAKAKQREIEESLRIAGLYRSKAKTIKQVSRTVIEEHHGSLQQVLSLPIEEARRTLMQLPGVGPKTADVVLLFSAKRQTIPIDTHVNRVSKRLKLAPAGGNYEAVRKALQATYNPEDYLQVHVLLILHGRKCCRARRPACRECPTKTLCPSRHIWDRNGFPSVSRMSKHKRTQKQAENVLFPKKVRRLECTTTARSDLPLRSAMMKTPVSLWL